MTVYAPTDVRSINVPGGCDISHEAADGERLVVDCPQCEPAIIAMRTGWANTPEGVHLTPDEIGRVEADKAAAEKYRNHTWGDPHALGRIITDGITQAQGQSQPGPAPAAGLPPEVMEMLETMRSEIADLQGQLAAKDTPPPADDAPDPDDDPEPDPEPQDEADPEPEPDAQEPAAEAKATPAKRARPKKSAPPAAK